MLTKNYIATIAGKLVASGAGDATLTSFGNVRWAIGDSATVPPDLTLPHNLKPGDNISMTLGTGEYLYVYGSNLVAVTATNAAVGDV